MSIPPKHLAEDTSASVSPHPYSDATLILPTDRRPPKWLVLFNPKVGIPLAILIVLASIPLAIRSWRISSLPQIEKPFDVEAFYVTRCREPLDIRFTSLARQADQRSRTGSTPASNLRNRGRGKFSRDGGFPRCLQV